MPDAVSLLTEHRPPVTHEPDLEALERILATPAPRPSMRRPRRILVTAAAAAVVAVAAIPLLDDSPDVVARAAAALDDPDSILHFTASWRGPQPSQGTIEVWRADGGRRERVVSAEGEIAEDADAHSWVAYERGRDVIRRMAPESFDSMNAHRLGGGVDAAALMPDPADVTDDLAALLERAQRGDAGVRMLPDTTIRGVPVHQVQIDIDVEQPGMKVIRGDAPTPPATTAHVVRIVSVDRETFLPVRVEEQGRQLDRVTDYSGVERLPRTPANEALLRMTPHPGAKEVVVGD